MSSMTVVALNDRLAVASKKFTRACEQITLLKQQIAVYISMFASCNETIHNDLSQNASREMVRQKIETLQNFKTIFFKYAHQKAEEITKIQVELYGDEAVQEAYQNSGGEEPAGPETTTNDSDIEREEQEGLTTNYWGDNNEYEPSQEFNFNNNNNNTNIEQVGTASTTSQLQLIEYDFLTA